MRPPVSTLVASLGLVALAGFATPAAAARQTPRVEALLGESSTPRELRSRLLTYADSIGSAKPATAFAAGDAWFYAGVSYDRGGNGDSAIVCYERAMKIRNTGDERRALAEALTRRQGPGDLARARAILKVLLDESTGGGDALVGAMAWATYLSGHPDSAAAWFAPSELALSTDPEWRYRMAHVSLDLHDGQKAVRLLFPLAVLSRKQDSDVMAMLKQGLTDAISSERVSDEVDRGIRAHDLGESRVLQAIGGQRVKFAAQDGFPLSGVIVAPGSARPQRAAVVLIAPGDTILSYDSLAVGLRRSGFASILLDVRGSGHSVSEDCPLPTTWRGREELLHTLVATDVSTAFHMLASTVRVDTSRYVVVASGSTASIAAEAAAHDPRIILLALSSPLPASVDCGPMRAWVASRTLRLFLVTAPEDYRSRDLVERLYAVSNRGESRVIEARVPGTGIATLRSSNDSRQRLLTWLRESWPAPAPRGTRPTSPRKR